MVRRVESSDDDELQEKRKKPYHEKRQGNPIRKREHCDPAQKYNTWTRVARCCRF